MSHRLATKFKKSCFDLLSGLTPGARFVLLIYCDVADDDTLEAFPGTPFLMALTGHGERQVQRYVQELRDRGLLELVENRGGKRRFATYRVAIGVPVRDAKSIPPEVRAQLAQQGLA